MISRRHCARIALVALVGFSTAACDNHLIGPENQLEVTNAQDQFQFQLTALADVTDSRSYVWVNTGTQATVDISQAITAGAAILTIRDENGTLVYESDIADAQDGPTLVGVAGDWQIVVRLESVSGTFNFRVQKAT